MSKLITVKSDSDVYMGNPDGKTFLVSDEQAIQLEELINKWRKTMSKEKELGKELKGFFPNADIQVECDRVSVTQDTFYSIDRRELARLEKKYGTGLWCDARNGKVYYYFHSFGTRA